MLKPFLFAALSLAATPAFAQAAAPQCSVADIATTAKDIPFIAYCSRRTLIASEEWADIQ